jgi:hypothetical protein
MDSMARSYGTTPARLLGVEDGGWDGLLLNTACRLAGLGGFAEQIEAARMKKTPIFPAVIIAGGL